MKIVATDIPVLVKIFFPSISDFRIYAGVKEVDTADFSVYRSEKRLNEDLQKAKTPAVIVNLTAESLTLLNCAGVIQLGKREGSQSFSWINNPDGTIRWFFPTTQKKAYFLNLYNSSTWRGTLFKKGVKLLFKLGLSAYVQQGQFSVFCPSPHWLDQLRSKQNFDHYAVFTGTKGENRKAVIALGQKQEVMQYAKLPLTTAAQQLTETEATQLQQANDLALRQWKIPTVAKEGLALLVGNVKNKNAKTVNELTAVHRNALEELYSKDAQNVKLADLSAWSEIKEMISTLDNLPTHPAIANAQVKGIKEGLTTFFSTFNEQDQYAVALAHGDFTPWNMFVEKQQIGIYDWELSGTHLLWYDAFHFLLQSHILIHRSDAETIQAAIQTFRDLPQVQALNETYQLNPDKAWRYYLLRHICYYLPRYLHQIDLHEQVHWQLDSWEALLS